ncbi:MAG TPA: helix-turn-helix domain-containing protein [Candidatus Eubacterium faecipullorum]|uniref:Helix-turn-helix domain-containing protein n=1 Tax=Candidatus Eubacterium faecipullorum TaxID=2838571 RepID=A0A9D1REL7_9FIRM|nr:helix-turn-helix domain-containing protein [Candidatus Eubacterium faecipullorum]
MFSERFRELRIFTEPRLKQAELGEKLGMSQRKVSRLETGSTEPTTDEIVAICRFFNVSADYILGLTDEFKRLK